MRLRSLIALAPLALVLLASPAAAGTMPPTYPILPNQSFVGVVNGATNSATAAPTVYTVCPGPATGRMGHPAAGQTLSVSRVSDPTSTLVGYTGSLGTSINAAPLLSAVNKPVVFTEYFVASPLPTTWTVPCDGDGQIGFAPQPGSPTARTNYVTVRFVNIAV
jgi:hypothetical protein